MDTALVLRKSLEAGETIEEKNILDALKKSDVVIKLTSEFVKKPPYAVWRIIALSEIPFASTLAYTKDVIDYIETYLSTPSGFSLTGKEEDLLPCYNAMLIRAFSKLGYGDSKTVEDGIKWIKTYQPFERNRLSCWQGRGTKKYGGCLKKTPCYIGVAKTVNGLIHYNKALETEDSAINGLIDKGMGYIFSHQLYKRLSTGEPINHHILDLSFPMSYQLNILELLESAYLIGAMDNVACASGKSYIESKRNKDGSFKIDYAYRAQGYLTFDKKGKAANWLTYLLNQYLSM